MASAYMFHMMNEARVSVGAGAVALGYTGYLHALDYARGRTQGRPLRTRTLRPHPCRWSSTPTYDACCWPRSPTSRAAWRWSCSARASSTSPGPLRSLRSRSGGRAAAGPAHPDREVLAVPVVPGRQRPRDPGARRLRLHPRLPGRAVLPGQPAEPDPRGHARHPGARPARPQGRRARRRRARSCSAQRLRATTRAATGAGGEAASYAVAARRGLGRRAARDGGPVGEGRPGAGAGQRQRLPRGARARGGGLALAGPDRARSATRPAGSTTASARRPATSSPSSCRPSLRSSRCWSRSTPPRSTSIPTCSEPDGFDRRDAQGASASPQEGHSKGPWSSQTRTS